MDCPQIDLYEFLTEAELQHYYNAVKDELKITNASQFKYATDEDLKSIGMSRPEIRRLRKFYEKHFPHGYFSKIKRLLQAPTAIVKRDGDCAGGIGGSSMSINPLSSSPSGSLSGISSGGASSKTNSSPSKVPNNKHIIPADAISVNKQLGTGEFGIVQQGVWTNGTERIQVAIKCLCRERMQSNPMEFLKEAAIMHSIEHENIVRLYGVVLATDSLMLVTELAHLRSLLECLKDPGLRVSFLTVPTLCEFGLQICNGMRYLENKRLIHRDLAARNILVFSKNKVKISDFGLSRALGVGKDYYKTNFNVNLKLPIAWCAPECINYLRFTNASDVWAYGVCLWEMFSYGFQPWAALTGLQILEAIDAPNYQRLEQPECCPREYYTLMMKCWQDDPTKRPKFTEIYELLPDMKPEQLKAVANCLEAKTNEHLAYRQNDIITVLDRNTGTPYWKGVLNSCKTGFFNPSNTVAYVEGLPTLNRETFTRNANERCSKRKLRTEMISKPQNDFKHTGHVGIDGASFGDIAFLGTSQNYNHVPRQIVTPYKPSEDIEQTPLLLPPTPTSPDSLQTASGYFADDASNHTNSTMNPSFIPSTENTPKQFATNGQSTFEFPTHCNTNPFTHKSLDITASTLALQNSSYNADAKDSLVWRHSSNTTNGSGGGVTFEEPHEYHEISDDEITPDKLDFGPSLLDEINSMFGSMSATASSSQKNSESESLNTTTTASATATKRSDFSDLTSKLIRKNSAGGAGGGTSKKSQKSSTVKQISVKDEKILNHAIEIANEFSARSMCDLVSDQTPSTQSPKRKFSFRFPHLSGHHGSHSSDKHNSGTAGSAGHTGNNINSLSPHSKKKNFTEELKSIPDLHACISEEGREAYNSLIERKPISGIDTTACLLRQQDAQFQLLSSKTLPRRSCHSKQAIDEFISAMPIKTDNDLVIPPQQNAPRPTTLPTRGALHRTRKADVGFSAQLPRDDIDANSNPLPQRACENISPCESPSYVTNLSSYKFPEQSTPSETDLNCLPVPSKEGKKHIQANPKRHVRKYPLIIPANGVQRTLNKVMAEEEKQSLLMNSTNAQSAAIAPAAQTVPAIKPFYIINNNSHQTLSSSLAEYENTRNVSDHSDNQHHRQQQQQQHYPLNTTEENRNYQNVGSVAGGPDDTASLQFETILEADFSNDQALQSPDVTDGFYNFSIHKDHYNKAKEQEYDAQKFANAGSGLNVKENDELRNLNIDTNLNKISKSNVDTKKSNEHLDLKDKTCSAVITDIEPRAVPEIYTKTDETNQKIEADIKENFSKSSSSSSLSSSAAAATTTPSTTISNSTEKLNRKKPKSLRTDNNELAGNALFQKIKESVDKSMIKTPTDDMSMHKDFKSRPLTEAELFSAAVNRLTDSNSVSCEDLLEFSDKKPKGRERGADSDEVRIMMKVLGKDSQPERCINALEFIDWDVHKAIKIIKLQNILSDMNLSLPETVKHLLKYEWDLHTAARYIKLKT